MIQVKAPAYPNNLDLTLTKIFLAGSIDMGQAEKWQDRVCDGLRDYDVIIFNPRRDDWDSSWVQSIDNPQFLEQVSWELDRLEEADVIVVFFDPKGPAPITLLELGMFLNRISHTVMVCCPEGYWRKGNVDIVCARAGVPVFSSYDELMTALKGAPELAGLSPGQHKSST